MRKAMIFQLLPKQHQMLELKLIDSLNSPRKMPLKGNKKKVVSMKISKKLKHLLFEKVLKRLMLWLKLRQMLLLRRPKMKPMPQQELLLMPLKLIGLSNQLLPEPLGWLMPLLEPISVPFAQQ
jgi:hypothetical protein